MMEGMGNFNTVVLTPFVAGLKTFNAPEDREEILGGHVAKLLHPKTKLTLPFFFREVTKVMSFY